MMNNQLEQVDEDDDIPQLSAQTLTALQEFYAEQAALEQQLNEAQTRDKNTRAADISVLPEDWQLSQFWYDDTTAAVLAQEAIAVAKDSGRIACVSCPTLYRRLKSSMPVNCSAICLEYDTRFRMFGQDFVPYDYNQPLNLPPEFEGAFDIVVADPPFLSEECLRKTTLTVRYLMKKNVILCTGAIMAELVAELLNAKECRFRPRHSNNLANEFRCFANYETLVIDKS